MRIVALAALAACGGTPKYLGAELPSACSEGDVERCAGFMAERDLIAGQLDVYTDARLRRYVQAVANRLARGAYLAHPPRVVIGDHDGTYAAFGEQIVVGRRVIERLASEAELAAIVAHELVHLEGRHTSVSLFAPDADAAFLAARRDAEAVADERAVALLELAGYMPGAMPRALAASIDGDDEEHPPRAERLAAATALAGGRTDGFEGRAELMRAIDGMIVGPNTRLGTRIDDTWVIAVLGVAIELRARDVAHVDGDALVIRNAKARFTAYPIGVAWARELANDLLDSAHATTALGPLAVGVAPLRSTRNEDQLSKLQHAVRDLLPQPAPGTWIVLLERPAGGLVVEISASTDDFTRDRWLSAMRAASKRELAAAEPPRVVLHYATRPAKVAELVSVCPDADYALLLDDPNRALAAGEPFKCTDR
ncbi:MAG TPA: M48 family metalloprotease [Kofleriaceae bacterium]